MTRKSLVELFAEDHAVLGRGFHELSAALRGGDMSAARAAAVHLNDAGGPHIAFEQKAFYPRLRALLDGEHVDRLYAEHADGLKVIHDIQTLPGDETLDEAVLEELLAGSERMETHIAECGDLFEAMGRIDEQGQAALRDELIHWRDVAPSWSEVGGEAGARPARAGGP